MSIGSMATLLRALLLLVLVVSVLAGEDYYRILGIKKNASDKEIKKAYRKLSKQYHPDKNPEKSAEQKFLDVGHAFEILSNPEKRKTYDQFGEEGLKQQQQNGGGGFNDPFDVFRNAFGGQQFGGQQVRKGQNKMAEIEVTLESIYKGDTMVVTVGRQEICGSCSGSGARSPKDVVNCPHCGGSGVRLVTHQFAPGIVQQVQMQCGCAGGKIVKHACSKCHGHKVVQGAAVINLHIDRGVYEGTEIPFEGESDESPDFEAGDLIIKIKEQKRVGGFARKESNLYWKESLSVAEALLGFKRTVKGLDGHNIKLEREGVTQPGYVQVIKSEGLPIYQESGHGDLFVEYSVVLPSTLSPKVQASLREAFGYKTNHSEL